MFPTVLAGIEIVNVSTEFFGAVKVNIGFLLVETSVTMKSRLAKIISSVKVVSHFMCVFFHLKKKLLSLVFKTNFC